MKKLLTILFIGLTTLQAQVKHSKRALVDSSNTRSSLTTNAAWEFSEDRIVDTAYINAFQKYYKEMQAGKKMMVRGPGFDSSPADTIPSTFPLGTIVSPNNVYPILLRERLDPEQDGFSRYKDNQKPVYHQCECCSEWLKQIGLKDVLVSGFKELSKSYTDSATIKGIRDYIKELERERDELIKKAIDCR